MGDKVGGAASEQGEALGCRRGKELMEVAWRCRGAFASGVSSSFLSKHGRVIYNDMHSDTFIRG